MKAIVPPETPGTTSAIPMAHPLSASTMYREKFMVCLRILVLNAKIRISRIQKQTCLRFCSGGVSSAQPKIGDKRQMPAFRKLSFHQFFGSLPFFRTRLRPPLPDVLLLPAAGPGTSRAEKRSPRRVFPQSAPLLSECRAVQGAHSSRTTAAGPSPAPRQVPGHRVRKSLRRLPGAVAGLRRILRRNRAGGRFPRAPKRIGTGYSPGSGHALLRRMNSTTSCSPSANFEKSSL